MLKITVSKKTKHSQAMFCSPPFSQSLMPVIMIMLPDKRMEILG